MLEQREKVLLLVSLFQDMPRVLVCVIYWVNGVRASAITSTFAQNEGQASVSLHLLS